MSTKYELLAFLNENINRYVSGQEIADKLGLSRNAIWKAANALKEQGYDIKSVPRKGYRLAESSDVLMAEIIREGIKYPIDVKVYDKVDSTNNLAKALPDCTVAHLIISDEQTKGRGRLGRSFYSPSKNGLYMTIAFKPEFNINEALLTTGAIAVSVCAAINKVTGLNPKIKWVNDLYLNDKKICGILTEAETNFETGAVDKLIIGIGINCFQGKFPDYISETAGYLESPVDFFTRNQLASAICNEFFDRVNNFNKVLLIREYKAKSFILGEQILIFNPAIARSLGRPESRLNEGIRARAIDIDENGGLIVEYLEGLKMRTMETITSGEVTVRKI